VPTGDDTFKVVLATKAGERVVHQWKYKYGGPSSTAPSIINFTIMRQWWVFIAKGGIVTVELTVISILVAMVFALLGALGRLSGGLSLRQAWDKYYLVSLSPRGTPDRKTPVR
jgi:ABC-type amino acid transport system permease subunit